MIETNPSRADYAAKFEEMIERYNAGSRGREEHFRALVRFARQLDEEQKRHLRENLNEEELAVFDILTRPGPELSAKERSDVKKVVQELLPRMKELLVLKTFRIGFSPPVRFNTCVYYADPRGYIPSSVKIGN